MDHSDSIKPIISILADDPDTVHRLNANAYQQSAITTFRSFQYAAFYTAAAADQAKNVRHVTLARRNLVKSRQWERLTLTDYDQVTDDGHNTISIGICAGDGTIHVSFDHHCDDLRFRISVPNLALEPNIHEWTASLFSPVYNILPGLSQDLFTSITYPRFLQAGDDLIFEARTGKAGAGSDILFIYAAATQRYSSRGTYLVGVNNNPYINGLSYANGKLHASWTYRDFIAYEGADDLDNSAHKAQAGPNGPENNSDLNYAFSADCGLSWQNSDGQIIARFQTEQESGIPSGILPWTGENNIQVQAIPKNRGIMNQEAQCVGPVTGDFHVLNRDNTSGKEQWRHYLRNETGIWSSEIIPDIFPTETGPRGDVASDATGDCLYFALPGNMDSSLTLMRRRKDISSGVYTPFEVIFRDEGFDGEPNIDRERLIDGDGVLSVFTRTDGSERKVVILDFEV